MISKQAFINRHKHEILGLIFESFNQMDHRHRSMFVELAVKKVEAMLARVYDDKLADEPAHDQPPPPPPPGNGQPTGGNAPRSNDREQPDQRPAQDRKAATGPAGANNGGSGRAGR